MHQRVSPLLACVFGLVCAAAAAEVPPVADEVLLSRGDITVKRADLMLMLETTFPDKSDRAAVMADNKKIRDIIADIFVIRVLAAEARQTGLAEEPAVRFKIATQADRILSNAVLDKVVKEAAPPDLEKLAREHYVANPEKFVEPEQVHAAHILIRPTESRSRAQALALAEDVRKQVMEGKKSFEDLAVEFSDDPSAKSNQGDLGFFARERMVKPFADAAFAMTKPDEIAPVVETQYGYHVIKYLGRKAERKRGFDEVKAALIEQESKQFATRVRSEKIGAVRSLEGITVNQDAVSAISAKKAAP